MSKVSGGRTGNRQERHLAAIKTLIERDSVTISSKQLVFLLAHLQASMQFQKQTVRILASVAAGKPDWESLDKIVETSELAEDILDKFIFGLVDE